MIKIEKVSYGENYVNIMSIILYFYQNRVYFFIFIRKNNKRSIFVFHVYADEG